MAMSDNKADRALFLSNCLVKESQSHLEIIMSGGFLDEKVVLSTCAETNISSLQASHEEEDTGMILHAVNSPADMVVFMSRDTDVFLIFLHHYDLMKCNKLFMMAGTSTKRKYVPILEICQQFQQLRKLTF